MNKKNKQEKEPQPKNLPKLSANILPIERKDNCYEVSVYNDGLTAKTVVEQVSKIKKSFPSLPPEFYDIFSERIKESGFSDRRLIKSVNKVIDNCIYPVPTIGQFIAFDEKIKLYTYQDMLRLANETKNAFKLFKSVKIGSNTKPLYASVQDIEKYNLELWSKK